MLGGRNKIIDALRLQELTHTPSYEDLLVVMDVCRRNPDKYILQSWTVKNQHERFMLRVLLARRGSDYQQRLKGTEVQPEWAFIRGSDPNKRVAWIHTTGDLMLVQNLTGAEVEGTIEIGCEEDPTTISQQLRALTTSATRLPAIQDPGRTSWTKNELSSGQKNQSSLKPIQETDTTSLNSATVEPIFNQNSPQQDTTSSDKLQPAFGNQTSTPLVLSGDIREPELENVLQSIGLCKMNGTLFVKNELEMASLYFHNGEIVDAHIEGGFSNLNGAAGAGLRGDHAFIEVLSWRNGSFTFDQTRKASTTSITRPSYALILEGVLLRDQCETLLSYGVNLESRFVRLQTDLTEAQLEQRLTQGLPLDPSLQKQILHCLSSGISVYEMLKQVPLNKSVWTPILFNLLQLNLLGLTSENICVLSQSPPDIFLLEENLVSSFMHDLMRPDTGMYTNRAFFYFVKQEALRFKKTNHCFSLLTVEARYHRNRSLDPLSNTALRECANRFRNIMGELDVIGHYQMLDFALLLPEEVIDDPSQFFDACYRLLTEPLLPDIENKNNLQITLAMYMPNIDKHLCLKERKVYSPRLG